MLDSLLRLPAKAPVFAAELAGPLARAAAAIARLDQALAGHPLVPALLYRARLDAVRRQAATDGRLIDPWHLAAVLEGLRLRMDGALRIIDRGEILAAARHALDLHQWLVAPDFDQEGMVKQAEASLQAAFQGRAGEATPLLIAGNFLQGWLAQGGGRAPARAALVRFWTRERLIRVPVPLTGAAALRPEAPRERSAWIGCFLEALAEEAADSLQLLADLERAWIAARGQVAGRRRNSRAAAAVDALAMAPLLTASTLAGGLGMAVKNAGALLEEFCGLGIAVEVTHRSKRRLYGLATLAPLRDGVAPPRRPEPGRGRGRPPSAAPAEPPAEMLSKLPPLTRIERQQFDYGALEELMAQLDTRIRTTRRVLGALAQPTEHQALPRRADDAADRAMVAAHRPAR